jgi:4-diphosphocytidyl-2-C-methyl-D-erythritol kinase
VNSPNEDAPAKINLALHILGRRVDGYHDLDTMVVFADIADRLKVVDSEEGNDLAIDGPFASALTSNPRPADNLVHRAAIAAAARSRSPETTRLHLTKNIPIGAGLGGGSADAAATLRLLARRFGLSPSDTTALARSLGADVPMCLAAVPLRARGIGDDLNVIVMPALPIVLVFPGVSVSTASVFGRLQKPFDPPLPTPPNRFRSTEDVVDWLGLTINGLEAAALREAPAINAALSCLRAGRGSLVARMTGSGSACFAVFSTKAAAESAAVEIQRSQPKWWVRATTTKGSR